MLKPLPISIPTLRSTPLTQRINRQLTRAQVPQMSLAPDPYDLLIKRQEHRARMSEQRTMYNILDPILNTAARRRLSMGTWYDGIPVIGEIANTVHGYGDILSRMYDIRDPQTMLMTTLRFFGDTFDLTSSLTVKPFLHSAQYGTSLSESYAILTGFGRHDGRYNYWFGDYNESIDWLPDNWAVNIIGEMLIDPSVVLTLGVSLAPGVLGAGKKAGAEVATEIAKQTAIINSKTATAQAKREAAAALDRVTTSYARKFSRTHISAFADPSASSKQMTRANKMLWQANRKEYKKAMTAYAREGLLLPHIDDVAVDALYEAAIKELGAKRFYHMLVAYDNAERYVMQLLKKISPIRVTKKAGEALWRKFKYADVSGDVEATRKIIQEYSKLESFDDMANLDLKKLEKQYQQTLQDLQKAMQAKDDKAYGQALENHRKVQEVYFQKKNYDEMQQNFKIAEKTTKQIEQNKMALKHQESVVSSFETKGKPKQTIQGKRTEYGKAVRKKRDLERRIEAQEAVLDSVKEDITRSKELRKSLNIVLENADNPKVHASLKGKAFTNTEYERYLKQLDEVRVKREKTVINSTEFNKLSSEIRELEAAIKVYESVQNILRFSMQSDVTANYLVTLMSGARHVKVRRLILSMSKAHFDAYAKVATENKKLMDEAIQRFSKKKMNLEQLIADGKLNRAQFDKTTSKAIEQSIVDEYLNAIDHVSFRNKIAKLDNNYAQALDKESLELAAMLQRRFSYDDLSADRGFLGSFIKEIVENITNVMRDLKHKQGVSKKDELMQDVNRVVRTMTGTLGDTPELARLFKSLKILNNMFTAKETVSGEFISTTNQLRTIAANAGNLFEELDKVYTKYGTTRTKEIKKTMVLLKELRHDTRGKKYEEVKALVTEPGGKYNKLRHLIIGDDITKVSKLKSQLSKVKTETERAMIKQEIDRLTTSDLEIATLIKERLNTTHKNYTDINSIIRYLKHIKNKNHFLDELNKLDYMMGLFKKYNMVVGKGRIRPGARLLTNNSTEYVDMVVTTFNDMKRMKGMLYDINKFYKNYQKYETYDFNAAVKTLLQSEKIRDLDDSIAENLFLQHTFAIDALRRYAKEMIPIDDIEYMEVEKLIQNFRQAVGVDIKLTPDHIIAFYGNLIEEVRYATYKMFNDYLNIAKKAKYRINRFSSLSKKSKLTKEELQEYLRLRGGIQKNLKDYIDFKQINLTSKEKKYVERLYKQLVENVDIDMNDESVQLLQALIYRQEFQPMYYVMQNMHAANFLMGNQLQESINSMHRTIRALREVTTNAKGEIISVPDKVNTFINKHYPNQADIVQSPKLRLDMYLEQQFRIIQNDLERLEKANIITNDHIRSNNTKKTKNIFNIFLSSTENEDEVNYMFANKFYMDTDEHGLNTVVYNMMGERYVGDVDFKNASLIFLDTETTGIDADAKVFQIGIVKVMPNGDREVHNIYLDIGTDIPGHIKDLTGHQGTMYMDSLNAQNFVDNEEIQAFLNTLVDDDSVIIAHNALFDMRGFEQIFGEQGVRNVPVIDTLPLFRMQVAEQKTRLTQQIAEINKLDSVKNIEKHMGELRKQERALQEEISALEAKLRQDTYTGITTQVREEQYYTIKAVGAGGKQGDLTWKKYSLGMHDVLKTKSAEDLKQADMRLMDSLRKKQEQTKNSMELLRSNVQRKQELETLQTQLKHYESIEKQKQEYLADKLVSKERRQQIMQDLQQMSPNSTVQDHHALYDAAMLEEILNNYTGDNKVAHRMLPQLFESYDIHKVSDLNNRSIGILNSDDVKVLNETLRDLSKRASTYQKRLQALSSSSDDDAVVDRLSKVLMRIEDSMRTLKNKPTDINVKQLYLDLDDAVEAVSDIEIIIKNADVKLKGTPLEYTSTFSDVDGIQDLQKILEDLRGVEDILESIHDRNDEILTAVFGDVRAQIVNNKLINNFRILSEYANNEELHRVVKMLKGTTGNLVEDNDKQIAEYFREIVKQHARDHNHSTDVSYNKLLDLYRQDNENALTRFYDFIDDVDAYVDFNRKIYGSLYESLKAAAPADKEKIRVGIAKVNEFMDKLERKYKQMAQNAKLDGKELGQADFEREFYNLLQDPDMSPLIQSSVLRSKLHEVVGLNITEQIHNFVKGRVDKYISSGHNEIRLFLNIDTQTTHNFYYFFKNYLLDPLWEVTKNPYVTPFGDELVRSSPKFDRLQKVVQDALANLRKPLQEIKYENLNAPTYHLGAINKHIEKLKKEGFYENFMTSGELVLRNEAQVLRLSKAGKQATKVHRLIYDALDGLTDVPEQLNTFKTTKTTNEFAELLHNLMKQVTGSDEASADVLSRYFKRNQKLTKERTLRIELLDSLLTFSDNNETVKAYKNAIKAIEEWASSGGYLKKAADGSIDPDTATELMHRIKGALWEYLDEIEPINYKRALGNLYDQGFTKKELFASKLAAMEQMQEVANGTEYSYKFLRQHFGEGREGAERMFQFMKKNPEEYNLIQFEFNSKSRTGVGLRKVNITSADDILNLDKQLAETAGPINTLGIVDQNTYYKLQREVGQDFKFKRNGIADKIRRHYLMPLKSLMLANANFVFSNVFDAVLKNMLRQEGGFLSPQSVLVDTVRAAKMHKNYMDLFEDAKAVGMSYRAFKSKETIWVDTYAQHLKRMGKLTPEKQRMITEAKFVHEFLDEPAASGQFQEMLMNVDGAFIGKGKRSSDFEKAINTIFYGKGPLAWNMNLNSRVEIYSRLALHINDLEKGLSKNESLTKILKTHYNYIDKSKEELYAEFVIPFMSFPIRSFLFWADAFHDNPVQTKFLSKLITRSWGQQEISQNDYAKYQASRGRLPMGNYSVNLGLTWMDAMSAMGGREDFSIPFADQAWRKLNPVAKNLMDAERPMGERVSRMPGASQITAFNQATTAFQEGSTDLNRYAPSMFNPYYGRGGNRMHTQTTARHPQFRTPYSYNTGNIVPNASRSIRWRMTNLDRYKTPRT